MSEIDKTIEELEAEVQNELSEAEMKKDTSASGKGAVAAEPMKKMDSEDEDAEDTGAAVTKSSDAKKDYAKKVKTDGSIPAKVKGDEKPQKLAAQYAEGYTDEEIRDLCHSKDHDCATVVEHPVWGLGKPVYESHAIPDDNGYVAWYDVQFKHGIEEKVMAEDMKILQTEAHHEKKETMMMPKTKKDAINAMYDMAHKMEKMSAGDAKKLAAAYMKMGAHEMAHGSKEEGAHEDDEEKKESVENRLKSIDVSEHVNALMNGEGDLSEEFKKKAATVFEAAVKSKIRDEVARLEDEYKSELDESIKTTKEELSEKVDTYLNYVVEEWMKENELAIERGLKGEIAEDFISGLKTLFEDHYVDIPDEKYDVLEAQSEKITELEKKLNEEMGKVIDLKNSNSTLVREQVISETTSDLTDTEIEKFKSLTEDVEFTDGESFKEKLDTLKESYFPKTKPVETKTVNDVETGTAQDIDTTDSMASYMKAIGKLDK